MSTTLAPLRGATNSRPRVSSPVIPLASPAYWLSGALAAVAATGCAFTVFTPGVLRGVAVMNGSARGTALVMLVVAVPLLVLGMALAARGSVAAVVVWLGAAAHLLYNALLLVYMTPFNQLFLLYVATLSLAIFSIVAVLHRADITALAGRFSRRLPARGLAIYIWVIVAGNFLVWMAAVVPGVLSTRPPAFLDGTGLLTNAVYAGDLAFWLPLAALAAAWLWRRAAWGIVVAGAILTMWVTESIGVATDQWLGHSADPASPVAAASMTVVFGALAVIGLVPLFFYYRSLDRPAR